MNSKILISHQSIDNGVLGKLGPKNTQTLTILASKMDKQGRCFITGKELAELLNLKKVDTAYQRIKMLENTFIDGKPAIKKRKTTINGISYNYYVINPAIGLKTAE